MKWYRAKNLKINLCSAAILLFCMALSGWTLTRVHAKAQPLVNPMQMGFYDLLADQEEVYNTQLLDMDGALLVTLTRSDDEQFVIRGRLDETQEKRGRIFYEYAPVRYNNPANYKMIFSFIDFLRHNTIWIYPITINKKSMFIGQSGMMFVMTAPK